MTWIVGAAPFFGYGIGISDIRVTLGDQTERDCLQKIYPVGRFIAAGFAGSVRIGFAMIDELTNLLYSADESMAWDPSAVAEWWPIDARRVFERFPDEERGLQSQLILVSVHPERGDSPWPRSCVYTFDSPSFEPRHCRSNEVLAIGCGAAVEPCRSATERLSTDPQAMEGIMQGEVNTRGGMATRLGWHLTAILKKTQPKGISSHLHYCWVYPGRIVIKTNDHTQIGRWTQIGSGVDSPDLFPKELPSETGRESPVDSNGPRLEHFVMPKIVDSWDSLADLLRAEGLSANGAVA